MALTKPKLYQVDTTVVNVSDPMTVLHAGAAGANVDIGFLINRASGAVSNVALYWSESSNSIVTAFTNNSGGTSDANITVSSYAPLMAGNIVATNFSYANAQPILSDVYSSIDAANAAIVSTNLAIVTANTSLKNYTDAQIISANSLVVSYVNTLNSAMASNVAGANAAIVTANNAVVSYVNAAISSNVAGANTAIVTANNAVVSYVNAVVSSNISVVNAAISSNVAGANAAIITANNAVVSYVDALNSAMASNVAGANAAIITANTVLKAYVDNQTSSITGAWTSNAATQQGQITVLQSQVYSDSNVNAYLSSGGAGNVTISNGAITLTSTGPGATTVGSSTSIPTIVTDAFGRIVSLTSNSVSTTISLAGTTGTGSIAGGATLTFASLNGMVVAASGSTLTVSSAQDLRQTAAPTFAGLTSSGNTVINDTTYISGITRITNSTVSSGYGNGALVVTGGAGVGGVANFGSDVYITGNLYVPNVIATTSATLNTSSPMVYFDTDPYPYNYDTGFYSHFIGGPANVYAHMGIVRNHNDGFWTFFSNVAEEPSSASVNFNDPGVLYDTIKAGSLVLANTTPSASTTTGALTIAGGAGISGNLNVNNAGYFGYNAINAGLLNPTIVSTSSSAAVEAGSFYVQTALINTASSGSSDYVAYGNNFNTDQTQGWVDLGFTGNTFSDPAYTITNSNDGYVFVSAREAVGMGGNLVLATNSTGTHNDVVIATGSFFANAEVARFHGNVSNGGYLALKQTTAATSTTTGALRVTGGVGVSGNVYADAFYTTTGLKWAGNGTPFSSGGGGATFTASSAVPSSPTVSDRWYNTSTDVVYEYQNVGTGTFWVDISGPLVVTNSTVATVAETLSPFLLMGA